jgi:SAM-dependent methyltransferase
VGGGSERWHDGTGYESYVGRWSRRVGERFLSWLQVHFGADWVDVGCGTGVLTRSILEFSDPHTVIGVDPSTALTARREPADTASVPRSEGQLGRRPGVDVSSRARPELHPDLAARSGDATARRPMVIGGYVWDYAGRCSSCAAGMLRRSIRRADLDEGVRFRARPELPGGVRGGPAGTSVPDEKSRFPQRLRRLLDAVPERGGAGAELRDGTRRRCSSGCGRCSSDAREPDGPIDPVA